MEIIDDFEKRKIQIKKDTTDNLLNNNKSLFNPNINISKDEKIQEKKQSNQFELNKEIFQIIQQKGSYNNDPYNNNSLKKDKLYEPLNNLNKKNIIINENKINDSKSNDKMKELDEINEITKKNYKADKNEFNHINNTEKNNKNIYTLLNSYYKDVNLNFKNDKINNKGKNFLNKNIFQESPNNNISINDSNISKTYNPYHYSNDNMTNNNIYLNNISNIFPGQTFINNQYNNYFLNKYNYYNYNFYKYKNKYSKRNNNIEPSFFVINLDNILKGIDKRTTIMIRHIPNKYSYHDLLEEINMVCKDNYDFLYLPLDSENNCNLGYAFINFINPLHIIYFYNAFKSRKWLHYNSYKECDLSFAKYQGKNELTSNIERNMGKNGDKRRLPMIFEIKNPPKINLFKQYYEMIEKYRPELLNDINWI